MTKRLVMMVPTIALALTGALVPNAAFGADDTTSRSGLSVARTDGGTSWEFHARGTSWELGHSDRGTSWESYDTLNRGTSWE